MPHPSLTTPLRVVVADDNPVVRAGLTALLSGCEDLEVVAQAADGREAYEVTLRLRPDVVLLDVRMPGVDGITALPHLARLAPVLMTTYSGEAGTVREALRLGAAGYLVHGEFTVDQLVTAVRDVRAGRARFTPTARHAALGTSVSATAHMSASEGASGELPTLLDAELSTQRFAPTPSLPQADVAHSSPGPGGVPGSLSRREGEVMELIASGMTNQQIAAACFISQKTVKNHINRIFAKLHAQSRGQAIAIWHGTRRGGAGS
ncbi:response regulator transcription factor [Streptomyces sp. MUM 203J]|uniref:response regulator transcription factor n=1 Tax=Streptomyces sp. MUM 203J TaxID=2791990 RepID=UPI001F047241|nr:response regulator transcription factor [Streptomyces sp. MUM 203J]MCH0541072.1 response regulator transcription factor [Streptomyces sp. MUM 203J]